MKRLRILCVLALGVLAFSAPAAQADRACVGTVGAITIDDNIYVPSGQTCTLNGTRIKGNVKIFSGATLIANGANVEGDVQAFAARNVNLRQRTFVGGNVQSEDSRLVRVADSIIEGDVQVKKQRRGSYLGKHSEGVYVTANIVGGNVQLEENRIGPYQISNNRIDGDLQFFKNSGMGTITDNIIRGNLQVKENTPRPYVARNQVDGNTEIE